MKKIFFVVFLFASIVSFGQITYIASGSNPSDNGSQASGTFGSGVSGSAAAAGDLVIIYAWKRTASGAMTISAGGQTWNTIGVTASTNATLSANVFWCIFNGTWTFDPSVTFNATTNNSSFYIVYRPTSSSYTWAVDAAQTGTFVDQAVAASFTITGWTPNNARNVSFAAWNTDDDNTWGTLTGTNWTKGTLSAQYRNIAGSDASASFAYQIQTGSAAATNNVSQTEATLGNDGGLTFAICFYEYIPSVVTPVKHDLPLTGAGGVAYNYSKTYYRFIK